MFDYLLILLAVVCFTAQFVFTKLYERAVGQTATASLVMLSLASLMGALIFFFANGCRIAFSPVSLLWAVAFAVIMIPYYMIGIKVLSLGSLAIYSMFMMLGGMLVPFFYGILLLKESVSIGKLAGTVLLTAFIVLQAISQNGQGEEDKKDGKKKTLFFVLCLVIFFINGMTGVIAKAHAVSAGAVDEKSFTVIYCVMTALLSFSILLVSCRKNRKTKAEVLRLAFTKRPLAIVALLGAAAYGGNFLQLLAADRVPASVQFPLVSGGVIVLSALVSVFLLGENLSKKEWISIGGAFLSTFLFAF